MAISTMYPAMPGSPKTTLAAELSASATSMSLNNASVLPSAPNLAVIGDGSTAEVVSYTTISGNTVSGLIRGLGGTTASVWASGTDVARNYTSFDHDRFIANIQDLESNKLSTVEWGEIGGSLSDQTDLVTAMAAKANLASPEFTGTPVSTTPSSGDNSTKIATTAFVQGEIGKQILYFNNVTVSAGTNTTIMTISDNRITTDMVVLECVYNDATKVTTSLSWNSNTPGKVTFNGTCTSATTARVILGKAA